MRTALALLVTTLATAPAIAQRTAAGWQFFVDYGGPIEAVTPRHPVVTILLRPLVPDRDYAFAGARLEVLAGEPQWTSSRVLLGTPGQNPGTLSGARIAGIVVGQIQPVIPCKWGVCDRVLEATWSTAAFTPRGVGLSTLTSRFDVYVTPNNPASQSRLAGVEEGRDLIRVVPAMGALPLGMVLCAARRRRR
jgi:hypothetical protein